MIELSDFREAVKNNFVEKVFISHPGGGWISESDEWVISVVFTEESQMGWFRFITHDGKKVMLFDTIDDAFQALKSSLDGLHWPCVLIPDSGDFPSEIELPF